MADQAGGFFHAPPPSGLLSPPHSTGSLSTAGSTLPSPRSSPLKSGSAKELAFRNYVDKHINTIQRRYAMKFSGEDNEVDEMGGGVLATHATMSTRANHTRHVEAGYESFREAARDIEKVVEIVWVSGTLGLQIPYLLTLALLTVNYIPGFPAVPRTMFRLLDKLDSAFASLIQGKDVETGEVLPGFLNRKGMSGTEKVRIKSLVERTRVTVVEVMSKGEYDAGMDEDAQTEDDENNDDDDMLDYDAGTDFDMEIARVYDKTLVELGDTLEGTAIGLLQTSNV